MKAAFANAAFAAASALAWASFVASLDDPACVQDQLLRRYLRSGAQAEFGRDHRLDEIRTYEQFSQRVPIRDYDELLTWINRIRQGEPRVLSAEPVKRLVPTSGSTAARKLIPYTSESHRELNRAVGPWMCDLYRRDPAAIRGPAYWSVTPVINNMRAESSAVPIGFDDDSAYLGGWFARIVDAAMAVPADLKHIGSIDTLRYLTLLLLLRRRDLSLISIWHPSFLELLFRSLAQHWDRLLADVTGGTCSVSGELPGSLHRLRQSRPLPNRASELARADPHTVTHVWPRLALVSCWADGHAGGAAAALAKMLPGVTVQPKGLLATEGVVSIPFGAKHPLAIRSHFFEFITSTGNVVLAADLKPGQTYDVVMTTGGGLWRYRLNDLVQVDGFVGRTPSIRFVGKAALISDRVGEKLSEGFVAAILIKLFQQYPPTPSFALLAPECAGGAHHYTLFVTSRLPSEASRWLDEQLKLNPQYAYCRTLGQLGEPRICCVRPDAYDAYCSRLTALGQRLGDIKPTCLSPLLQWSRYFAVSEQTRVAVDQPAYDTA